MTQVHVTDRDGAERDIEADDDRPLMETLRDGDTGIEGTCGGECSCGTCHVYVDAEWLERLPPMSEDEELMLEAVGELVERRANSRLSCQIPVSETLEGIRLEIAPAV